jgi:hypothetical protein
MPPANSSSTTPSRRGRIDALENQAMAKPAGTVAQGGRSESAGTRTLDDGA